MTDILEIIKKFQEMYGDDVITTADKINRPDPKPIVKDIEAINEFVRRNPQADGGRIPFEKAGSVKPYADRLRHLTVPKGYVSPKQLAEELGVTESTLKKYRTKGVTVDKYPLKGFIDKTFKPIKKGLYVYYLKPTEKMLENYNNFKNRTTISRDLLNDVKKLHKSKLIKNLVKSKNKTLPTLEEVVEVLGKDVKSHGRAANAMATLSKMYSGEEYRLLKLPKNEETGKFIFKALRKGGKFNPYKAAFYNLAIEEIDKTLGNETGTLKNFKRYFKDNLNKYLGKGHGVSLNEVASISGMVSNDMAPYGAFVDLTNSKINKGLLANFQGTLTNALTEIDKLKGREKVEAIKAFNKTHIPNFKKQIAAKYGNKLANSIRFTEIVPGARLTDTYKAEDLARYKTQGIDLESLAKKKGYYLDVKGARPYTEFLDNKKLTKAGKINAMETLIKSLCPNKASGGRIGYQNAGAVTGTVKCGSKRLEQIILKGGANKNEQVLAEKILKAGKGLKNLASLKGLLGPAALAFEVSVSVGLTGYDMLSQGKTFREAVGDSVFNYALGDRTKIDPKEERYKGYAAAGVDKDTIGKISAFENAMDEVKNIQQEFEKEDVAYRDAVLGGPKMSDAIKQKQIKNYYDQVKKNQELIKYLEQPQTKEKLKIVDDNLFPAMLTDADAKRKAMQMTKPLTVGFGNTMDFLFPKGFLSDTTYKEDREKAINYMPAVQEYYRSNQFAGGGRAGLSGGDTSGRPPESGPMSQGLRSLYNNGRKL